MTDIDVIIPTLLRADLQRTIDSVRNQQVDANILVRYDPGVNEYVSRDWAVDEAKTDYLAFIDDDAYYEPGALITALKLFKQGYSVIDGAVQGNIFGRGVERFDMPYLGIGTALFITKKAYVGVDRFDTEWGTSPEAGWRMDTALLYKVIEKYGDDAYRHSSDIVVNHPNPMQSQWNPYIEWARFYFSHMELITKHILSLDPRLQNMVRHKELLDNAVHSLTEREFNDIILKYHKGMVVEDAYNELSMAIKAKEYKGGIK